MLKAELHSHIKGDKEHKELNYSVYELIDEAAKKHFDILGITCHDTIFSDKKAEKYAKNKGILLISGVERTIEGKHVLIYNSSKSLGVKSFKDLEKFKKKYPKTLIIAPHPYNYISFCLKDDVLKYRRLFDALEYSFFYTKIANPNIKTEKTAKKINKPLVGSSDTHYLSNLGKTYTLIDSKKERQSIFKAVKKGKTQVVSSPLSLFDFFFQSVRVIINLSKYYMKKYKNL